MSSEAEQGMPGGAVNRSGRGVDRRYIEQSFTYHAPHGNQVERYGRLRDGGKDLALSILDMCPASAERTLAIRHLETALMWANKSIAVHEAL